MNRVGNTLEEFDLSLETTHHGPWIETPSMFIEIGSTSATWGHKDAAKLLAGIIYRGLGLDGGKGLGNWEGSGQVVVTLGGGHYAPRANSLGLHEHVWLGHMLATYALPFEKDESGKCLECGKIAFVKPFQQLRLDSLVGKLFAVWIRKHSRVGKGKQFVTYWMNLRYLY